MQEGGDVLGHKTRDVRRILAKLGAERAFACCAACSMPTNESLILRPIQALKDRVPTDFLGLRLASRKRVTKG
jgi:hypothetical protein